MRKTTILTCALLCSASMLAIAKGSSEENSTIPPVEKQFKTLAQNNDPVIKVDNNGEFKIVYGGKDISRAGLTSAHNYSGQRKTMLA